MDSGMYQDFLATEFVDMFPQTNGDILVQTILAGTGSRCLTSIHLSSHVETVVLLSQLKQKPDDYINVTIELDNVDITSAETKATYDEIKKYVAEHNAGMKVSNLYISQVKRKCGIEVGKNLRVATRRMDCLQGNSTTAATDLELVPSPNLPKNEDSRQPQCPEDKESAIVEALKHFKMNS